LDRIGQSSLTVAPSHPSGWSMRRNFQSSMRTAPIRSFCEIKDLVMVGGTLAGQDVGLVVTFGQNGALQDSPADPCSACASRNVDRGIVGLARKRAS